MRALDFHRHWFVRLGVLSAGFALAAGTVALRADAQLADEPVAGQPGAKPAVTTRAGVSQVREPRDATDPERIPADSPVIKFDSPLYNFGHVLAGTRVRHDFRFTNTGNQPLIITKVKPSCGCSTAGDYDKTVPPDEVGTISISMQTRSLSGQIRKSVAVTTNDSKRPTVHLQLTGEVVLPVKVDPPSAFFGTFQDNVKQERVLTILNKTDKPLEITGIKCDSAKLQTELKTLTPGKEFKLTVTALPPFESGYMRAIIFLETNLPEMRQFTIDANGYRPSDVMVSPRLVSLPSPIAGDFRRQIFVRHAKQHPLKLTDLKVSGEELKVSLKDDSLQAYWIIVTAPTGYQLPKAGERVTFKTDDPSTPRVTVPIVRDNAAVLAKPLAARQRSANRSATLLEFAKRLLDNGDKQSAVKWLDRIIEQYPESEAANEARQLLRKNDV